MAKHFSPRLKAMAVKSFIAGDGITQLAFFYETTPEKMEQAIRAKLIEQDERLSPKNARYVPEDNEGMSDASKAQTAKGIKYTEA